MKTSVSIIIPTRGNQPDLERSLPAAVKQLLSGDEVIVVGNGFIPRAIPNFIKTFSQKHAVRYVHISRRGPSAARNKGISLARGKIIAFLDDDCAPKPGWLRTIKKRHTQKKHMNQPIVLQGRIDYIYEKQSLITELFHLRNKHDWIAIKKTPGWKMGKYINFINAGNFSVEKKVLQRGKIAFHETLFPFVGEEREITAQFHLESIPIVYAPEAGVIHLRKKGSVVSSLNRSFLTGRAQSILENLYQTHHPVKKWFKNTHRSKSGLIPDLRQHFWKRPYFATAGMLITGMKYLAMQFGRAYGKLQLVDQSEKRKA